MEHLLLNNVPAWILSVAALAWVAKTFILPWYRQWKNVESKDMTIADVKKELDALKAELKEWEERYHELDHRYRSLRDKYNTLLGMMKGFQVYLQEKGAKDFPMMDELTKHTDNP